MRKKKEKRYRSQKQIKYLIMTSPVKLKRSQQDKYINKNEGNQW